MTMTMRGSARSIAMTTQDVRAIANRSNANERTATRTFASSTAIDTGSWRERARWMTASWTRARAYATEDGKSGEEGADVASEEGEEIEGEENDEIAKLRGELEEKDAAVADLKDRILRTMAEMENLRERTRRQAEDAKKFAVQGFCKDLLDVADNLDRAISTVPEEEIETDVEKIKAKLKSFREGVVLTEKQLSSTFNKHGVAKFNPEGEEFDANLHMALFNVPIPEGSDAKAGTVAAVTKTGYTLHERVIRAAEVGVYQ